MPLGNFKIFMSHFRVIAMLAVNMTLKIKRYKWAITVEADIGFSCSSRVISILPSVGLSILYKILFLYNIFFLAKIEKAHNLLSKRIWSFLKSLLCMLFLTIPWYNNLLCYLEQCNHSGFTRYHYCSLAANTLLLY